MTGTIIDIFVLVVIIISAIFAFIRGFIREFLTIVGVAGGLLAAYMFGPVLAPIFRGWFGVVPGDDPGRLMGIIPYDILADALAYIAIFFVVVIVLSLFSHMLSETIKKTGLGAIDRTLGVFFGIARGVLLVGLLYLPFHILLDSETKEEWFEDSRTQFYLEYTAGAISGFIPEDTEEKAQGGIDSARERLKEIQILKETQERVEGGRHDDTDETPSPKSGDGYEEETREDMNELFEEQAGE